MGKLNFRGYLISRFYPICEIRENLMHAKNMFYSSLYYIGLRSCYAALLVITGQRSPDGATTE